MATVTIRISAAAFDALREMSSRTGEPMPAVLERAIEHCRRTHFLTGLNEDFERLRGDPDAWQQELDERAAWDHP